MEAQDDPEARIRDLERPLSDIARNSELGGDAYVSSHGHMPPTTPWADSGHSRAYAVPVAIAVLALVIAGGVTAYLFTKSAPSSSDDRSEISGGGGTLSDWPADRPTAGPAEIVPPSGAAVTITVAGIGENKTIACDQTTLSISGIENTVTVTGHCASLSVSGVDNVVTVDSADGIVVSGFDNRIEFHAGDPEISTSGSGNTVDRG
jgi:hypothetical protein